MKDNEKDIIIESETKPTGHGEIGLDIGNEVEVPQKPKRKRRPRSDRGKPRGVKTAQEMFDIPLKLLLLTITQQLANNTGNTALAMTDTEAKNIEAGFNQWVKVRAPDIAKWLPEIYLLTPILQYGIRVAMAPRPKPVPVPLQPLESEQTQIDQK